MSEHVSRRGFVKTVGGYGSMVALAGSAGSAVAATDADPTRQSNATKNSEKIRLGTLVQAGVAGGPANYIRQILPYGFESFSLTFWGKSVQGDLSKMAAAIKEVLGPSGAVISSLGYFGNPLIDTNARDAWKKLIDAAPSFGCNIVCGFTGRIVNKPVPDSIKPFAEVFGPLAKQAADQGVRLAFENCEMGGDWHRGNWNIAHNPTAWEMMFNAVPSENIGLEWEPAHQLCALTDPLPQLRKWVKRVFHMHGKDANVLWDVIREHGIGGSHPFVFHRSPGFGDTNWTEVISILRQGGFVGSIDIEGWHDPVYCGELEMTGQVASLKYLKECRGTFVPNPS